LYFEQSENEEKNQKDNATCETVTMWMPFQPNPYPPAFGNSSILLCFRWLLVFLQQFCYLPKRLRQLT
jgi:hypothetical protein